MAARKDSRQDTLQRLGLYVFAFAVVVMVTLPPGTCSFANTLEPKIEDYPRIFDDLGPHLEKYYWDERRFQPERQFRRALASLENVADEIYVAYGGPAKKRVTVHLGEYSHLCSLHKVTDVRSAFATLKKIFAFLERRYEGETPINDIRIATANGFLSGLDPHTMVFSRTAFDNFYVHIEGEIFGVGMLVGVRGDGDLTVIEVLKNTPAKRAGFNNGDRIVRIGDESTVNMSVGEAVKRIRGRRSTTVVLTVKRKEGEKIVTKKISVERDRVVIKSVESKLLPHGIGYVKVTNFDKNTVSSLKKNLERLHQNNGGKALTGLIFDLRNNSGGLLKQASDMVDLFLEKGTIYSIADREGVESFDAVDDGNEPKYPIVALCNQGSASGAEIVIGALQKNSRALVLGSTTFGKGSVQQLHPLPATGRLRNSYKAQLKITVSEYLIPGKISIQENGVVPDILARRIFFYEKNIDYFPNERRGTEKDYKHHIVSKYAKNLKPLSTLDYPFVYTPPDEDEVGDEFMSGDIKPLKDKLVQIAVKLLQLDGGSSARFNGPSVVRRHEAEIAKIRNDMMAEISTLLAEQSINWKDGKNPHRPPEVELDVSHEFLSRPSTDEEDPYSENVLVVSARVKNLSNQTIHRLAGLSSSGQALYNDREFLFGEVEPGQTITRSFEVILRPSSATRSDIIAVALTCPGVAEPYGTISHEVVISAEDFPEFSYSLTLVDVGSGRPIDHLRPGTKAQLIARIHNVGKAAVRKGVAILRHENGKPVFLNVGRLDVKNLAPGKTQEKTFEFHVREDSELDEYEFEFGVYGSHFPTGINRHFVIPATAGEPAKFRNGEVFRSTSISLKVSYDHGGRRHEVTPDSTIITDTDSVHLSARIEDGDSPFHAWVSISQLDVHDDSLPDKVSFAKSGTSAGNNLDLSADIPVKVGQNVIAVVTTNDRGLSRRRVIFVRRTAALD